MSKCNYTAPDGTRSKVGEYLENKYGEQATVALWQALNSVDFMTKILDWKTDTQYNLPSGELSPEKAEELLTQYGALPIVEPASPAVTAALQTAEEIEAAKAAALSSLLAEYSFNDRLQSTDRIVWAHPGSGKTKAKENGKDILDFDTDYKPSINTKYSLAPGMEARNKWRAENPVLWDQEMRVLWTKAKTDAKSTGKRLFVSDMIFLRENSDDFDRVVTMPAETFADRSRARGDFDSNTLGWKANIDTALSGIPGNKLMSTDKYLSDILPVDRKVDDKVFEENLAKMFAAKLDAQGNIVGYYTDVEQKAAVDSILTDVYASLRGALANGENLTVGTLLNALKNTRIRIGIATKLATGERKTAIQDVVQSYDQLAAFALERLRAYGFSISDKVVSRISKYLKETTPKGEINEIEETNEANPSLITDEETQETIVGEEARGMRDWSDVSFELNPRDTASKRLKFFLATIKDSELGTEDAPRAVNILISDPQLRQRIVDGDKRYIVRSASEAANIKLGPDGRGSVQVNGETFEVKEAARPTEAADLARFQPIFEEDKVALEAGAVVYSVDRFNPKSSVPKNKLSYLGFPTLANFEQLFEDLLGVLGDTDRSWENYRALLIGSKRPNLMRVAIELENSDEQLRNEFVKVMSKQYQPFTMVLFNQRTKPDGTKLMQARPINANRSSAAAVIMDQWKENQKEAEIIKTDEIGRLSVNTELANKFQTTLDKVLGIGLNKLDQVNTSKLHAFARRILEANGINLTDEMFSDLMVNMARHTGKQSFAGDWKSQFRVTADGKPLGMFSTIIMKLSGKSTEISDETGIDVDADSFLKNNNPLYTENSVMKVLANVALKYTPKLYSSSHRSSEGKSVYDWGLNTYESHTIRRLKNDKDYRAQMQQVTFAKDSWLLKNIVNDPEARTRLQLGYLDGLKARFRKSDGITRSAMSDREQNLTVLSMFQNTGYKYGHFVDMTKSDKTTTPVLSNVLKLVLKDGRNNQVPVQRAMNDVFKSEFNRIR